MNKHEAMSILMDWQKRHPKDAMFDGDMPTEIGRKAIEKLQRYEYAPARVAVADCELEDTYSKLSGVFKRLGKPAAGRAVARIEGRRRGVLSDRAGGCGRIPRG